MLSLQKMASEFIGSHLLYFHGKRSDLYPFDKASELDSLEYTIEQAKLAGNTKDAEKLELARGLIEKGEAITPRNLVRKYGGGSTDEYCSNRSKS
ncbi:hypothetical protein ABEX25_11850 [Paenibacillus thiaminolyticus]|uniref:hypothetical protein n=1 Tax=Paenibacillus thiaminolyticus TaxID=49283 RepID=UPI003D2B3EEC